MSRPATVKMSCPDCSTPLVVHFKPNCSACEKHICPKCHWGTRYFCPLRMEPETPCDRYCTHVDRVGDSVVCRKHGRRRQRTLCEDLICGRYCACRRKQTTTEFHPAPKEDRPESPKVECKTCSAYDIPIKENMQLYKTWGFVCSDCADGILGR